MRVLIFGKTIEDGERGDLPDPAMSENDEQAQAALIDAGIMVDGDSLKPASAAKPSPSTAPSPGPGNWSRASGPEKRLV